MPGPARRYPASPLAERPSEGNRLEDHRRSHRAADRALQQRPVHLRGPRKRAQRGLHRDPHRHRARSASARPTPATSAPRRCRRSSSSSSRSWSARPSTTSPSSGGGCTTAATTGAASGSGRRAQRHRSRAVGPQGQAAGRAGATSCSAAASTTGCLLRDRRSEQLPDGPARRQDGLLSRPRVPRLQVGAGSFSPDGRYMPDAPPRRPTSRGQGRVLRGHVGSDVTS